MPKKTKWRVKFGDKVKAKRIQLGLTQAQLAAGACCSRVEIAKIETGAYLPSVLSMLGVVIALKDDDLRKAIEKVLY